MSTDPGPHVLADAPAVLTPGGALEPRRWSERFYEALAEDYGGFGGHVLFACHTFDTAWPSWEVHPKGDELVFLIEGDIDFVLWEANAERVLRVDEPGSYIVVPKGTWHTARPRKSTTLLFATPGEGTLNASSPE